MSFFLQGFTVFYLNIESSNLNQLSVVSAIFRQKLRNNGHRFCTVDFELTSWTKVSSVSLSPMVVIATIFVTNTVVPDARVCHKISQNFIEYFVNLNREAFFAVDF